MQGSNPSPSPFLKTLTVLTLTVLTLTVLTLTVLTLTLAHFPEPLPLP